MEVELRIAEVEPKWKQLLINLRVVGVGFGEEQSIVKHIEYDPNERRGL